MSAISIFKQRSRCNLSLYLVANRPSFQDERLFFSKIQAAVRGGVSCEQLRDHRSDYTTCLKTASRFKRLFPRIPLFINTLESMKVAHSIGAEGVYLEEGISPSEARRILGEKTIIGVPVKKMDDIFTDAADYFSVKVFASKKTCPKNDLLWGIEGLREIRQFPNCEFIPVRTRYL
jgi:thiamine-phosphate diphosphorylase